MPHKVNATDFLGKTVTVKMDRPLGSHHPDWGFLYERNYGYIPDTISGDGEELDVYVLNVDEPLEIFTGTCVAVIHRTNDNDDKLIVIPTGTTISDDEIERQTHFCEKRYTHVLIK